MKTLLCVALTSAAFTVPAAAQQIVPSQALHELVEIRLRNLKMTPSQVENATRLVVARAQTSQLDANEEVALGLLYFYSFDGLKARPILERHMQRADAYGRQAFRAVQQMTYFGQRDVGLVEQRLREFRSRFAAIPSDLTFTAEMVNNLANYYKQKSDPARATDLILEDVSRLQLDIPFRSFQNILAHFDAFRAAGRADTAQRLLENHLAALLAAQGDAPLRLIITDTALTLPHRSGTVHLDPFANRLFEDAAEYSVSAATRIARIKAILLLRQQLPLPQEP